MAMKKLDEMGPEGILALMDAADARALRAVEAAREAIACAAAEAAEAMRMGGRLVYVGAGTSGRLGVLDASECPPTFSANPSQVVGIIAGGRRALTTAVEGAEDDRDAGRSAVKRLRITAKDMVVGISASGNTPYVLAALEESAGKGANVWLISCSSHSSQTPLAPKKLISLPTGPEVIQGSTRLAAGTATKLALNRITTAAFIMQGKVYGDLMVDVMPTNAKLVKRAADIIRSLTGVDDAEALKLLKRSGMNAKVAIVMKLKGLTRAKAARLLEERGGFLREALK